jgi:hypothetical protein
MSDGLSTKSNTSADHQDDPPKDEPSRKTEASEAKRTKPSSSLTEYRICCHGLPLAVYREVAAHLRQIDGVNAGLLPQTSQVFDYLASQIGGLWISYQSSPSAQTEKRVEMVLSHYGDRFGTWEVIQ